MKTIRRWFGPSPSPPPTCVQRRSPKGSSPSTSLPPEITKEDWELALRLIGEAKEEENSIIVDSKEDNGEKGGDLEEDMRGAFGIFDVDGDGRISAEELRGVLLSLGDEGCTLEDCERMIGAVAPGGGGFVCFEDFERMMACERSA